MDFMDWAIINAGISFFFCMWAVHLKEPPYGAIPNTLESIVFYVMALI